MTAPDIPPGTGTTLVELRCHACGSPHPLTASYACPACFGPLEPHYDYAKAGAALTRDAIAARPLNLWRYRELLPITGAPQTGFVSGWTPLIRADRLAARLGLDEVYVKDDSVNRPSLSYKDRVVSVALTRAIELGFTTVGCASTGNLANSVAAHAARLGLRAVVFIPADLEAAKVTGSAIYGPDVIAIRGTYDDVNRLCAEVADRYGWGLVNVNLRAYYAEGAKTMAFEIAEQLGWRFPRHLVCPVAGGTLLPRMARGFRELGELGLVAGDPPVLHAAQAAGCAPVVGALHAGLDFPDPVRPHTIARSIAIGNPADGFQVLEVVRASGGWGDAATDDEIRAGMALLAETEGIFTEPAGGTTVAVTRKLVEQGRLRPGGGPVVLAITGNGYKTAEAVAQSAGPTVTLGRSFREFEQWHEQATWPT